MVRGTSSNFLFMYTNAYYSSSEVGSEEGFDNGASSSLYIFLRWEKTSKTMTLIDESMVTSFSCTQTHKL